EYRDPVVSPVRGPELDARLDRALPETGAAFTDVFREFEETIAKHCRANGHQRFFAYVSASADPAGMVAELLAAAMNQNVTAWRSSPGAAGVERLVVRWLDEMLGFGGDGILTGGGSAANFNAVAMAILRAERNGVRRADMTLYSSEDTHLSIAKAARILGIDNENLRALPLDAQRRMKTDALRQAIDRDRKNGKAPVLIAASAGTANCGAIDPLNEIGEIASRENIWLHIDGAYGAPAAITQEYAWMRDAFSQADSLSIDPHKWLYAPLDVGCLLFRDDKDAQMAFMETAAYTAVTQTDPVEAYAFFDHGMELSRRFRALKLWFAMRLHGVDAYRKTIEGNIALRRYLDECIRQDDRLEWTASDLSISCFRVTRPGLDDSALNALNQRVLNDLLETGRFLLSPTTLDGKFMLRVCIVNFRTQKTDIDELVQAIVESALRH
ncbi:MAG: aminotransferase class V-fold PLP-dependent enzyme, partial [Proteobacteria bacterium]|nr:aminotransferase class V-fold PLP-dependent enzyme [Pseudomonadota bacterium]